MAVNTSRGVLIASIALAATAITGCRVERGDKAPILLFTGTGTSPSDVAAVETVLESNGLSYATASSFRLNWMSESEIRAHRLLIVPGGNFIQIGKGLTWC